MRRIAVSLALLALAVGLPVAWLVARALDAEAFQREVRHEAVANRIFDEMERSLSSFLLEEEARPFEAYRAADLQIGRSGPEGSFLRAYFERRPDGSLVTLGEAPKGKAREGEAREAKGTLGDDRKDGPSSAADTIQRVLHSAWPATPSEPALASRLEPKSRGSGYAEAPVLAAEEAIEQRELRVSDAVADADRAPTAPVMGERQAGKRDSRKKEAPEESYDLEQGIYGALDRLNLGSQARRLRKQKVSEFSAAEAGRTAADSAGAEPLLEAESEPFAAAAPPAPPQAAMPQTASREPARPRPAGKPSPGRGATRASQSEQDRVRVLVDPMVGRSTGDGELLLYRTVFVGDQAYRQGLLLDAAGLSAWLDARVIAPSGLSTIAGTTFSLGNELVSSRETAGEDDVGRYRYAHRFAEPFDALSLSLSLAALPAADAASTIWLLAVLLAGVAAVGLLAVYRMVSVVVQFAERRNNFVASVTHELKTPLTAIRMYAEMLRDGLVPSDDKRHEYYATIGDESERLSRLIDNVLEFSKLEKGQREMNLHAGSLTPVVAEACETLRPHAERLGFRLRVEADDSLPAVRFDRDAVVQVLFNLVDNAMKYAKGPAPEVLLSLERDGSGVALRVRDFGPGVPAPQLARIFEPFYRGGDELTRTTKGTGIGLALVKELGERMGARVAGRNRADGGFEVSLAFEAA